MENPLLDIFGLSKPLTKLIEVLAKGTGVLYEPRKIRKEADARAYALEVFVNAKNKINLDGPLTFNDGIIQFSGQIEERAISRIIYQETKRQENIESVVSAAYNDLELVDDITDKKVDDDWITRFFNIAQEINDEKLRLIWGKILSGEIINPGSYSFRTLAALKNISRSEAEVFSKLAPFVMTTFQNLAFILSDKTYLDKCGIKFTSILLLKDLNILSSDENLTLNFTKEYIKYSDKIIILTNKESETTKSSIGVYLLTKIGQELLNIITQEFSKENLEIFAETIKKQQLQIKYTTIESYDKTTGMCSYTDQLVEI